ncbi:peptidoglycan-binding domain-containing protein [Thioclava sp. A2]|uniref:peptidoglycan-binding domain-containing protein n=1 Tax=Thioclava sp. FCG-A2 TaxID=3080562 RepID=UPI00295526A8|nr:peptidoglycan-binding domain-containing protein [Thioclava sp. A2]MDV7272196.1 peptidoglycan-binding domain-containing protein [Thioclava sp. A2]
MKQAVLALIGVPLVAGCMAAGPPMPEVEIRPTLAQELGDAPPAGAPGCYHSVEIRPAKFGTVKRAVEVREAVIDPASGKVLEPALYEERDFSAVVDAGETLSFETMCVKELTPEFVATVQRALKARGLYRGTDSGVMDGATRSAVRAYQKPRGLDADVLSRRAAMEMGLVIWQD